MRVLRTELNDSRTLIENRLSEKSIEHFCFPWFQTSDESVQCALESGYRALHIGVRSGLRVEQLDDLKYVRRVQEEYLLCLPCYGRSSFISAP